jgi:hypothetical protein
MKLIEILKITEPGNIIQISGKHLAHIRTTTARAILKEGGYNSAMQMILEQQVIGINPGEDTTLFITLDY